MSYFMLCQFSAKRKRLSNGCEDATLCYRSDVEREGRLRSRSDWQRNDKGRTDAHLAFDSDGSAVEFDGFFGDRQP